MHSKFDSRLNNMYFELNLSKSVKKEAKWIQSGILWEYSNPNLLGTALSQQTYYKTGFLLLFPEFQVFPSFSLI